MKKYLSPLIIFLILSNFSVAQYPRNQNIQAAEYFINADPGQGSGTPVSITPGQQDITINLTGINLSLGSAIFIRFKSSNGSWSAARSIKRNSFFVNDGATIKYGEYFINHDPGQGLGTQIIFINGIANLGNFKLHQGDIVYFRIQDSYNRWSPARSVNYHFLGMRQSEYRIKLASSGNYTNPVPNPVSPSLDSTCGFITVKNNIFWHSNDTIYLRFQTNQGFYSEWRRGIIAQACSDLTICSGDITILTATGGSSYQWSNGMSGSTITVSPISTTTYGVTVSDGNGAYSGDSVTVYVNPTPVVPIITINDKVLISSATSGNQWYFNDSPIPNATNQSYTVTQSGLYFVRVSNEYGCFSDSDVKTITFQGLGDISVNPAFTIYPNPSTGIFSIRGNMKFAQNISVDIINNLGIRIKSFVIYDISDHEGAAINLSELANGCYFLRIKTDNEILIKKFCINH